LFGPSRLDDQIEPAAVGEAYRREVADVARCEPRDAQLLGQDASVKRGYVCVYRPDPRSPIRWDW
jgi:hypothetical protein